MTHIGKSSGQIIVSESVPPEVMDAGAVRMGGGIHANWLLQEIMRYLPDLLNHLPGAGF